jgi:predicted negative regulator of RcsB-dependent stress response
MESDITQSALFYKLWAWGEKNRKQLLWGCVAVVAVGLAIAFWMVHQNQTQTDANDALSKLTAHNLSPGVTPPTSEAFLKVAADYSGTDAGQRALLLGASELFTGGKFDEARAQFQSFLRDHGDSPFAAQAALGVAASFDAQGKTNDAVPAYQSVVERYPNENVVPQARLALARLLEGQGKYSEARTALLEVVRSYSQSIAAEAGFRLQQLNAAHPELVTNAATRPIQLDQLENATAIRNAISNRIATNKPAGTNKP